MDGRADGQMDGWMNGRMENLPILQDFFPYRGCCPTTAQLQLENSTRRGKVTADHMSLGEWFSKPSRRAVLLLGLPLIISLF